MYCKKYQRKVENENKPKKMKENINKGNCKLLKERNGIKKNMFLKYKFLKTPSELKN